jgi:hypothetical protein
MAEAQGQFGMLEEGERPPLEAGTRGLVKTSQREKLNSEFKTAYIYELLLLLVVTGYNSPMNRITNPNRIHSHVILVSKIIGKDY